MTSFSRSFFDSIRNIERHQQLISHYVEVYHLLVG